MRRMLKWLVVAGVLAGMAGLAVPGMIWWKKSSAPKYLTTLVSRGRVETVVNSTGTVKPVRTVSVGAFISGPVAEVRVNFTDQVKAHDVLAKIDDKLLIAAVDRDRAFLETQQADLSRIEALLEQAVNNEGRAKKLRGISEDYLSDTEWDQFKFTRITLEAQRKLAKASIKQAEATLKNSEINLKYALIVSPEDGIVIDRKVDPGQTVAASFQTPELFIIAPDMHKYMFVFASVDEADIGMIDVAKELGKAVKFTVDAYPGRVFEGQIDQIRMNSTTTQNVVTYPVVIKAGNKDLKLLPGMTANITFEIEVKENVLRVPASALRFTPLAHQVHPDDRHYLEPIPTGPNGSASKRTANEKADLAQNRHRRVLWVQAEEWLRAVPVTLGMIEHRYAEVLDGALTEGQAVVTGTEGALAVR